MQNVRNHVTAFTTVDSQGSGVSEESVGRGTGREEVLPWEKEWNVRDFGPVNQEEGRAISMPLSRQYKEL